MKRVRLLLASASVPGAACVILGRDAEDKHVVWLRGVGYQHAIVLLAARCGEKAKAAGGQIIVAARPDIYARRAAAGEAAVAEDNLRLAKDVATLHALAKEGVVTFEAALPEELELLRAWQAEAKALLAERFPGKPIFPGAPRER
ncbi:MAG: hypothetical protein RMK15_04550 [Chloroflexota bacterium]|nr:hypothetical protein [Chloroflexota bacterium]